MSRPGQIPSAEALPLSELVSPTPHGIASRVLARNAGGTVTLFAFDAGEALSEHTAPFDALVLTIDGTLALTIGARRCRRRQARSCGYPPTSRTRWKHRFLPGCC